MLHIGQYNTLRVQLLTDEGAQLGTRDPDDRVVLPTAEVPAGTAVGDQLEVFLYTNSSDELTATTKRPHAVLGDFAPLKVVDLSRHGAFVDWGLGKDLLIPFREQMHELEVGDVVVVKVCLGLFGRVIGATKLSDHFDRDVSGIKEGQEVSLLVYDFAKAGIRVVVDNKYAGMLYRDDTFKALRMGDRVTGWVKATYPAGRLDVSTRRGQRSNADEATRAILKALDEGDGFLALHDKSDPKLIARRLQISKKAFKRAAGALYRERVVMVEPTGLRLIKKPE